ncbi:TlpA family protein disulfide reductase [Aquimarina sediminis]|uniref:TlpA family protein disulfide reductase n=1 Tax=Aquimarina sediminis TaxID=2070536 RepID=UPI000C9FFCB1|nr:TlpA disulfide reductase family protein [Aquimarina sediminis]
MKNYITITLLVIVAVLLTAFYTTEEEITTEIPSVTIKTLEGKSINSKALVNRGEPTLLVFWATCCAPCRKELSTISKVYAQWKNETGINVVGVSVDLPKYAGGVASFVATNNWDFDIYLDVERNLMHKMKAMSTPHSFLINKEGKIVWDKQGFISGDEKNIIKKIKELM